MLFIVTGFEFLSYIDKLSHIWQYFDTIGVLLAVTNDTDTYETVSIKLANRPRLSYE